MTLGCEAKEGGVVFQCFVKISENCLDDVINKEVSG